MFLVILKLLLVSLIPVGCATVLVYVKLHTNFSKWKKIWQILLIAGVFGATSILGTVLSIRTPAGPAINVRDASPIIAGLLFNGPAAIIAGIIGGVYRFVAAYWDPTLAATQIACSVATIFSGIITALIRKYIFNNHFCKWYYGVFIAVLVEDFHMLMVFLTYMKDIEFAYTTVRDCILPMMLANAIAVVLASFASAIVAKDNPFKKPSKPMKLISQVQLIVSGSILVAYFAISLFTYGAIANITHNNMQRTFANTINDVVSDVDLRVDEVVKQKVEDVQKFLDKKLETSEDMTAAINEAVNTYDISEVNIIGSDNIIKLSTHASYLGYDMAGQAQSNEFTYLLTGTTNDVYVQDYQIAGSGEMFAMYAGAILKENTQQYKYFQIGLYEQKYFNLLNLNIEDCALYRHINEKGFIVVTDQNGFVRSTSEISPFDDKIEFSKLNDKKFKFSKDGKDYEYYTKEVIAQGYHIIAFGDVEECDLPTSIGFLGMSTVEIFIFMLFYCVIFVNIKRAVVSKIENISGALNQITEGNLDVVVNERSSFEMNSLSDDINKTVFTLKENARKQAEKNAEELRFAKTIQYSVLPTNFPKNDKFEIFASMDTAKEVGGDFYDFYYIDREHVAIQIADVSGKGVPAAMFMMQAKSIIKNLVESGMPIDEAYTEANRQLCEHNEAEMFVTAWLAVVNLSNGHVDFVNAGHNPPLIKAENGGFEYLKSKAGFVLGGFDGFKYKAQSVDIKPGSKIYLYTDGVTEAMSVKKELYAEERLQKILMSDLSLDAQETCKNVLEDVRKFTKGAEQSDDITMLCFALNENESSDQIEVDAKIENLDKVTEFVDGFLVAHKADPKAKTQIDVAIDEIYSNIVHYAYHDTGVGKAKVIIDFSKSNNKAIITFEDRGEKYDPLQKADPNTTASLEDRQIGGLGIFIVKKTMDNMEYEYVNGSNVLKLTKTIK